jgi:hypothetical protein
VGILCVPNKTASMYVEQVCDFDTTSRMDCCTQLPTTLIVRDPVSWYISGYRHCVNPDWRSTHSSYGAHGAEDFAGHLEKCLRRRQLAARGSIEITPFDFHSWMNCRYQAQGLYYELSDDQNYQPRAPLNVQRTVKLEDTETFENVVKLFSGKTHIDKQHHNQNSRSDYPRLTPHCQRLLHELDDWSHSVGYNLADSIDSWRIKHDGNICNQ